MIYFMNFSIKFQPNRSIFRQIKTIVMVFIFVRVFRLRFDDLDPD